MGGGEIADPAGVERKAEAGFPATDRSDADESVGALASEGRAATGWAASAGSPMRAGAIPRWRAIARRSSRSSVRGTPRRTYCWM